MYIMSLYFYCRISIFRRLEKSNAELYNNEQLDCCQVYQDKEQTRN